MYMRPPHENGENYDDDNRLEFLESGKEMDKNVDVMEEVLNELKNEDLYVDTEAKKKKSKKSKKVVEEV